MPAGYGIGTSNPAYKQAQELYKQAGTTPFDTPLWKAWLPRATEQINSDFASRGLYDSGLAANALSEAQANMAANIYQNQFGNRLNATQLMGSLYGQQAPGFGAGGRATGGGMAGGGTSSGGSDNPWYWDDEYKMKMQQDFAREMQRGEQAFENSQRQDSYNRQGYR